MMAKENRKKIFVLNIIIIIFLLSFSSCTKTEKKIEKKVDSFTEKITVKGEIKTVKKNSNFSVVIACQSESGNSGNLISRFLSDVTALGYFYRLNSFETNANGKFSKCIISANQLEISKIKQSFTKSKESFLKNHKNENEFFDIIDTKVVKNTFEEKETNTLIALLSNMAGKVTAFSIANNYYFFTVKLTKDSKNALADSVENTKALIQIANAKVVV